MWYYLCILLDVVFCPHILIDVVLCLHILIDVVLCLHILVDVILFLHILIDLVLYVHINRCGIVGTQFVALVLLFTFRDGISDIYFAL